MDNFEENTSFHNKFQLFQKTMVIDTKLETLNLRLDESVVSEGDQLPNISTVQNQQNQQLNANFGLQINEQRTKMPSINIMNNSIQNKSTDIIELKNIAQISQNNEHIQQKATEKHVKIDNSMNKYFSLRGEENLISITEENQQKKQQNQNELPVLLKLKMNLTNRESKIIKNLRVSNKKIRKFINDISDNFFERDRFYLQCCAKIYSCFWFNQIQNKTIIPLFHPQSNLKIALDMFFCLVNCLFFFFSSILITFSVDLDVGSVIYDFMYIMWLLQISIKLNTAIYQKANLIQSRKLIALNYIKRYALYDLIPFILILIPYQTLQRAINLDLEYYYHHNYKKDDELNQMVLSKISSNLLHDLKEQYFGKILEKIPFLSTNFSHETLQKLAMIIEEESYLPGQIINENFSQVSNKLIYIVEGSVKLVRQVCEQDYDQPNTNNSYNIGKEQVLGEASFFGGVNEGMIYQACDFTRILTLERDKFLETIRQNEKDLQVFCSIREKVGLYQDYEPINLACKVCFKNKHLFEHCPLVHFDKSDYTIKENFFLKQKQLRQSWDRKQKPQPNAVMNQALVEEKQREHQKNSAKNNQNQLCPKRERFLALSTIQSKDLDQQYRCSSDAQKSFTQSKIEDFEEDQKVQNSEYQIQRQRQMSTQKYKNPNRTNVSINQNIDEENIQDYPVKERKSYEQSAIMSQNLDFPYQSQQIQSSQQNLNKEVANLNFLQNQQIYYPTHIDQRIDRIEDLLKSLVKESTSKLTQGNNEKLFASENAQGSKNNQQPNLELDQKRDYDIYFPYGNSQKVISEYNQKIRFNVRKLKTSKIRKIQKLLLAYLAFKMSQSVLKVSDDLIENQQFQKKRLTDQIEENTQLKKLCDHLEESCNSEIFTTYRQSNNINENGFNDNQINNSNREGKTTQQEEKVRQIHKFSQSEYLVNNSVITTESFHIQKDKNQTKYKNNLLQNKHQTMSEERQITFNDESVQKSVQSSIRGSYIQKSQKKPEIKYDFSKSLQLKKDLLKLTRIRKKIMTFFNNKTIIGRTNLLKNNQIQSIINDLSDVNDSLNRTNSKRTCLEILQYLGQSKFNFLKHIPPFNPQNSIVFFLNFIFCLLNCLFYLVLSIDIIFDVNITETFIQVGVCLQIVEILIKLNTSVYIHTEYFSDREVIFLKYLKQNLIYDLLPLLSLIIQFYLGGNLNIVLKAISFIKIYNVDKDYKEEEQNQSVLDKLSINLKQQLKKEYFGRVLSHFNCLNTNFSEETKQKLALQMQEEYFLPNQIIFNQEKVGFDSLMFVVDGEIELTKQSSSYLGSQIIGNISQNEVFGTYSFFTGQADDLQAKAITFTSIIKIQREIFQNIIKDNDKDQQQFNMIKDNILYYDNYQLVNISCSVCKNFKHLTTDCPQVHFDKLEFQNKLKFYQSVKQKRGDFIRKKQKNLNTLSQIKQISQNITYFEEINFVSLADEVEILGESSSGTESDAKEIEKESDEQSLVIINQNDHRKSVFDSHIKEEKVTRKSKTIQDVEKNVKYLNVFNENAIKEKSNQFLPRVSVLENLYEISQAEGVTSRTSVRVHKKREQIKLKQDLLNSFQNLNSFTNVEALTIMKHPYENPWLFDKQKDYQYYFPEGNLKMVLTKHNRISRQKYKLLNKAIAHKKQ
ncbi:hypothetical protein ABPG73_020943 [Tetrahymena malaccensis]